MPGSNPLSAAWIGGRPVRMALAPFPTMRFVAGLCAARASLMVADDVGDTVWRAAASGAGSTS